MTESIPLLFSTWRIVRNFIFIACLYLLINVIDCVEVTSSTTFTTQISDNVNVTTEEHPELICGYEYLYRLKNVRYDAISSIPTPTDDEIQRFTKNYVDMLRFPGVVSNMNESIVQLDDRMVHVLIYFANRPLPDPNVTDDDFEYIPANHTNEADKDDGLINYMTTNPQFNSRDDVRIFVSRTISRIILQCPGVKEDLDLIMLHPDTKPFALTGASYRKSDTESRVGGRSLFGDVVIDFHRDGDYDFALMDLILLAYTLRNQQSLYPNQTIVSDEAQQILERRLLSGTVGANSDSLSGSYEFHCRIRNTPILRKPISLYLQIDDTENHVLMTQVARYLTNELFRSYYPNLNSKIYDNTRNGNTKWMLNHLAAFMGQEQFYEYNSKPYQGSTVVALNLLYTFAKDESIKMATRNILDMITVWNTVQSDHLRRFVPFRRQPLYVSAPQSWAGDLEYQRLSLLVGTNNVFPEIGRTEMITTAMSDYRIDPIILDLFFTSMTISGSSTERALNSSELESIPTPYYFVGHTGVAEIYASTEKVLISAGGNSAPGRLGSRRISPIKRPLRSAVRLSYLFNYYVLDDVLSVILDDEKGWSRPTTIIPRSYLNDYNINSFMRYTGHRIPEEGAETQNLCVAPNFACGLQLDYGTRIGNDNVMNNCSTTIGNWTFLNLYHNDSTDDSICPNDGYYVAIYNRPCDVIRCSTKADTFGLLEIMEPNNIFNHTNNIDFITFQEQVIMNNPDEYSSEGIMTYTTISGNTIEFEIHPIDGEASIVRYDTTLYDRDYSHWPIARSPTIQSTTPGRITINNPNYNHQRLILDVTIPMQPRRLHGTIPNIRYSDNLAGSVSTDNIGYIFDDASSFMEDDNIKSITCFTNMLFQFVGYRMVWSNGLSVVHGSMGAHSDTHLLQHDESIIIMTVDTASSYSSFLSFLLYEREEYISYIQIQMNTGRRIHCGRRGVLFLSGNRNPSQTFASKVGEKIGAFYGRTSNNHHRLLQLGAVYTTAASTTIVSAP